MYIKESPNSEYDVCIIGSGAGGGMAAKVLSEAGFEVVMLEAGPWFNSEHYSAHKWPYETPNRGAATKERPFGEYDAAFGGWDIDGEPYSNMGKSDFKWFRSRMLGGRTNHWGRVSLRFGPLDFKPKSRDGLGTDWPVSYDDIKPYYDKTDRLIGLFGSNEGIYNEPDGVFMKPPQPRCWELYLKDAANKLHIPMISSRMSIITEPLNGRAPCHYCSQCNRGCETHSNFSSPNALIPPAMKTGKLKIINNAMAREITSKNGLADQVIYIDKETRQEHAVKANIVVLAASSCESVRLLLNSKSSEFPDGLANTSGVVGKYLMDSTGTYVTGVFPKMLDRFAHNEDGADSMHLYVPWWLDNKKLDFPRGYHIEYWGGLLMPSPGDEFINQIQTWNRRYSTSSTFRSKGGGGYGKQLKQDFRKLYGSFITLQALGECVSQEKNYCEIDPDTVDEWGIPTLRFNFTWSDYEYKQSKHMQETMRRIVHQMGGEPTTSMPTKEDGYAISAPGEMIHETGGIRMGDNPKTSVLNKFSQAHDVKNLFIADGGSFVSSPNKNPTWTILALAMRASEYIVDQRKKKNI